MKLESLKLVDYRNITKLEVEFDESVNVIYGLNGQGKTNLVESIDFLSSLKSGEKLFWICLVSELSNSNKAIFG